MTEVLLVLCGIFLVLSVVKRALKLALFVGLVAVVVVLLRYVPL